MVDESKVWLKTSSEEGLWFDTTRLDITQMTDRRCCRVALAGKVAEYFDLTGFQDLKHDEQALWDMLHKSLDGKGYDSAGGWSWRDWQAAQGWGVQDANAVYSILKRHWKTLLEEAEKAIANAT
jgi:hypothetical protein